LQREKLLATVVRLLETTFMRIGNVEYARENRSFGLTTLRNRHVEIDGSSMTFSFRGKSGQEHEITIVDRRLARIVKACQDLPGYELFPIQERCRRAPRSRFVGCERLSAPDHGRGVYGERFSYTWAGTVQTALALADKPFESETEGKRNIVDAVKVDCQAAG